MQLYRKSITHKGFLVHGTKEYKEAEKRAKLLDAGASALLLTLPEDLKENYSHGPTYTEVLLHVSQPTSSVQINGKSRSPKTIKRIKYHKE